LPYLYCIYRLRTDRTAPALNILAAQFFANAPLFALPDKLPVFSLSAP
jgi:hypothetical protein